MQITNYWAQPQIAQNKAAASIASTMDFLDTSAKGSVSNNSGSAGASQSAISGASPAANFSASLAATSVDAATTGTATSTNPDFTSMTRQQMRDWVNEQLKSGKMTFDQSSPFVGSHESSHFFASALASVRRSTVDVPTGYELERSHGVF